MTDVQKVKRLTRASTDALKSLQSVRPLYVKSAELRKVVRAIDVLREALAAVDNGSDTPGGQA